MNPERLSTEELRDADAVCKAFAERLNSVVLSSAIKHRSDGPFLVFEVAEPNERLYSALEEAMEELPDSNCFKNRSTIGKRAKTPSDRISVPEAQLLISTISESLTIDRYSFAGDFFSRYTRSVTNLEHQISANANFLVYGRRGSGKSSLLAYAMHTLRKKKGAFAWVALQTYARRQDAAVVASVLSECVSQLAQFSSQPNESLTLVSALNALATQDNRSVDGHLNRLVPRIRNFFSSTVGPSGTYTVFLDDLHVVGSDVQPRLLGTLYATCRGNRGYIKASGIEQLSRPWDSSSKTGLEPAHDVQTLRLDYNLTMPDRSKAHIVGILDAQARYCGLPEIAYLANDLSLSRLVWVAAAVPRDALSLFSLAIQKGIAKGEKKVSATSVNTAASEMAESKLRDIDLDAGEDRDSIGRTLDRVREFCVIGERKNAFLLEIRNSDPVFQDIQKLIALRLVHVLHEGITPREAGRRYMALMLDYGFYVGIRAAKSVDLFQREPERILAKTLRQLPVFPLGQ